MPVVRGDMNGVSREISWRVKDTVFFQNLGNLAWAGFKAEVVWHSIVNLEEFVSYCIIVCDDIGIGCNIAIMKVSRRREFLAMRPVILLR